MQDQLAWALDALEERRLFAAPSAPVITEPLTNGQVVSRFDVHMEVNPTLYSDPDGDAHQATSWEIRETAANGGAAVWQALNITDPLSKVHIHFGDGTFVGTQAGQTTLLASRAYVLHVKYIDSSNAVSTTSMRNFTTATDTSPVPGAGTWIVKEGYKMELAAPAGSFRLPVNVAFVPNPGPNPTDPFYYVTELYGSIKVVNRAGQVSTYATGLLDYNPAGPISGVGEQGLTGIVVEPTTGDLFVAMLWNNGTSDATRGGATLHYPKVERLHSSDGGKTMATRTIIKNMQPETQGQSHQISNLSLGPDGKLYVHMGDGFTSSTALSLTAYRGKVLRMNLDGTAPTDNPLYNGGTINARDYIYTYGHRNPFGGAWRASNGKHWVVENGNGLDRMVDLTPGASYGWDGNDSTLVANSDFVWNPAQAPVNIAFVQTQTFGGSLFPTTNYDDAFVTLSGPTYAAGPQTRGKQIVQFTDLDTVGGDGKISTQPLTLLKYNGTGQATVAGLAAGPDGLYFSDLYRDDGVGGSNATGANVYRLRYVDFQPKSLSATTGPGQVALSWIDDQGALSASFNVYRYINHGDTPTLVAANVLGTSYTDTTAAPGVQYHYFARAVNSGGESNDSNEIHATAGNPNVFSGSASGDSYYLKRNGASLDLWIGGNGTGTPTWSYAFVSAPALTFNGLGGNDTLTIDNSAGPAIPAAGISFDGGADADAIHYIGSAGAESVSFAAGSFNLAGATVSHSGVEARTFKGGGGSDDLTITGGAVALASGEQTLHLSTLSISAGAKLDLADADLIVESGSLATIRSLVMQGVAGTSGITSSTSNGSQILALFDNALVGAATWNGQSVSSGAIVGKYTYFGDMNLDGQVTGDDYTVIDANLNTTPLAGVAWLHGDANLDGNITGDDYTVIDANLGLGVGNPLSLWSRRKKDDQA